MHVAICHEVEQMERVKDGWNKMITTHDDCQELTTLIISVTQKDSITNNSQLGWHRTQKDA